MSWLVLAREAERMATLKNINGGSLADWTAMNNRNMAKVKALLGSGALTVNDRPGQAGIGLPISEWLL